MCDARPRPAAQELEAQVEAHGTLAARVAELGAQATALAAEDASLSAQLAATSEQLARTAAELLGARVELGLGRIVALHHRSSTLYQIKYQVK